MGHIKIKVGDILLVNDDYRLGKQATVRVTNMNLYPKAETGPRFEGEILNGGSFKKENFRTHDIIRNFGDMSIEIFKKLFPEKLI